MAQGRAEGSEQARDLPEAQKKTLLEFFAMLDGFVPKLLAAKFRAKGDLLGD